LRPRLSGKAAPRFGRLSEKSESALEWLQHTPHGDEHPEMAWRPLHLAIVAVYLAGLVVVGILSGRTKGDSNQYLNATASLPLWVCSLACIAANCGSLDVLAMMALGAQYGIAACHFYWIGAIPALLVVAFWLLPAYRRSGAPTILGFIAKHYGDETRTLIALCMSAMMLLISGVSLCAFSQILAAFLGWTFVRAVLVAAPVVLFYTWTGGFRATVYSELLHFTMVVAAVAPLLFLMIAERGGSGAFLASIDPSRLHAWKDLPLLAPGAPMDRFGLIVGLGFVLSFSYWGTDFVQMQRALAVRRERDAPFVPLSLGAAKLIFALIIVLPGVAAPTVLSHAGIAGNWNSTLPALMFHYYSPFWLVIGFIGLAASLASTFSNNVAGFTSAWVQGIYQQWISPGQTDRHYTRVSRLTNAAAILLSIGAANFALHFQSLMEYIQLVLATFNAPLFALVMLAVFVPSRAVAGARMGFLAGLGISIVHQVLVLGGVLHYGSQMAANFYGSTLGFAVALACALSAGSLASKGKPKVHQAVIHSKWNHHLAWPAVAAGACIAAACLVFTVIFW
jgi:SSS family solute:Na+ symporter